MPDTDSLRRSAPPPTRPGDAVLWRVRRLLGWAIGAGPFFIEGTYFGNVVADVAPLGG